MQGGRNNTRRAGRTARWDATAVVRDAIKPGTTPDAPGEQRDPMARTCSLLLVSARNNTRRAGRTARCQRSLSLTLRVGTEQHPTRRENSAISADRRRREREGLEQHPTRRENSAILSCAAVLCHGAGGNNTRRAGRTARLIIRSDKRFILEGTTPDAPGEQRDERGSPSRLPRHQARPMLEYLASIYPRAVSREELATALNLTASAGHLRHVYVAVEGARADRDRA